MSNPRILPIIHEAAANAAVELPQAAQPRGASLPVRRPAFTMENAPALTEDFQKWHRATYGDLPVAGMSLVLVWAKSQRIELTAAEFQVVSTIFENVQKAENEAKKKQVPVGEPNYTSLQQWSRSLQRAVDLERDEKEKHQRVELDNEDRRRKSAEETSRRETFSRDQLRSMLLAKPLSRDATSVKNLEWLLTTKNIPSDDLMDVIAYLSEIAAMHPRRCR